MLRRANHTAFSEIAMQHADDGNSRHENFDRLLVHSVFLMTLVPPLVSLHVDTSLNESKPHIRIAPLTSITLLFIV